MRSNHQPSKAELTQALDWAKRHLSAIDELPFSFVYGGKRSRDLLAEWVFQSRQDRTDRRTEAYTLVLTDPQSKLQVECEAIVRQDFPAVEWVITFENQADQDSPILEDVQALDIEISRDERPEIVYPENEFLLHKWRGSSCQDDDFLYQREILSVDLETRISSGGGRSSSGDDRCSGGDRTFRLDGCLPFYNVQAIDHGIITAVGWSGQWQARFKRDLAQSLRMQAGMEGTHLKLHPGERIRTPRMLLFFWQGDRVAAHNKFRQMILEHYAPHHAGAPAQLPFAGGGWFHFEYGGGVTETNQIAFATQHAEKNAPIDTFWLDAGWYGKDSNWATSVGDWTPRSDAFPNGLRPLVNAMKKMDMKFMLWFEPERAYPDTPVCREHPDWFFDTIDQPQTAARLLNFGHPDARCWITDHVSAMIESLDMDIYRQDMNFDPLPFWHKADAPDRQGISEIRHIEGLYAFWDELQARHPGILIDNCATGGRRIDLEAISRTVILTRSDYTAPAGVSSHGFGLAHFVPMTCPMFCYLDRIDSYVFRSMLAAGLSINWDVRKDDFDSEQAKKNIAEFELTRDLFYGDFYPLTSQSCLLSDWLAYQFHRPDLGRGMVMILRRPDSPYTTAQLQLAGLTEDAIYEVTDADTQSAVNLSGRDLMAPGDYVLPEPESSQLLTYTETKVSC